jgi:NAD(P)-dependent dehydrogenase (short-subunit alcohol dehydrogenase family)
MDPLSGKVAVVTGGASGIGFALAERFLAEGMQVMVADVEAGALADAVVRLRASARQPDAVAAFRCDVGDEPQVLDLATETYEQFGTAHVVCNNAGVGGGGGPLWEIPQPAWDWAFAVNLWGVLHGIRAFVPRLLAQGEGHVVNTASLAGLKAPPFMGPYNATKHAVVALSETLAHELASMGSPVRVSALCPGFIRTRIAESERNWPEHLGEAPAVTSSPMGDVIRGLVDAGGDPAELAGRVVTAIREERFFVLSQDEHAGVCHQRGNEAGSGAQPTMPLL